MMPPRLLPPGRSPARVARCALALAAVCLLGALAGGCGRDVTTTPPPDAAQLTEALQIAHLQSTRRDNFATEYRLGPGDLVDIEVVGKAEFSTQARVSPRGEVAIPILGVVTVAGATPIEASAVVQAALSDGYVRDPVVNVIVLEFSRYSVLVFGSVNNAGRIELSGPRHLLDVLMLAGGLTETAGSRAIVYRANPDHEVIAEQRARLRVTGSVSEIASVVTPGVEVIDLAQLIEEGNNVLNVPIYPEDRINIPSAGRVYLRGSILKPGEYRLRGNSTTLTQIIAQAGGYLPFKSTSEIQIQRRRPGAKDLEMVVVDVRAILDNEAPDFLLRDGDDVFFPTSWWRASISNTLTFLDRVLFGFGPAAI